MPTIVHRFDWPDRVVVGTIGAPGSRTFYLQARDGARIISVVLEKQQCAVLAQKIDEILNELLEGDDDNRFSIPAATPVELLDNDPLEQPVDPEFRTGPLSLGWDPTTAQIVIEAYPLVETDDDASDLFPVEPEEVLEVRIPVGTARAFVKRTFDIVLAGRPRCPICGTPMDASGHVCPPPDDRP
jgi:uncharacterized repeat protein (TIGR03847 family)